LGEGVFPRVATSEFGEALECGALLTSHAIALLRYRHCLPPHSHSIVPGGLLVTSYTTRFTPFTSLMIRVATAPKNFMSNE
jgi:hypothetical protein